MGAKQPQESSNQFNFDWSVLNLPVEETQKIQPLVSDERISALFFDVFEELKRRRKERKITLKEFLKGLFEIIEAIALFAEYKDSFSPIEKKLQISILKGCLEGCLTFLEDEMHIHPRLAEKYKKLNEERKKGNLSLDEYWEALLKLVVETSAYIHDLDIPYKKLRYITPFLLAFLKYYQCSLWQKMEQVKADSRIST